ncbi:MAG: PspA/IM30 family protein [Clostridia bacterium]|nr:PspA/IM30 family protein [Clostridia bacterium]
MGILKRFKDIMSSNIMALLDKAEDPAKMIDKYMADLTDDLAKVREETAAVMAQESSAKRALDDNQAQIDKYDDLAKRALIAGSESDAKVFIGKKQQYAALAEGLSAAYENAKANAEKMRAMHDKLVDDISALEARRQAVKSKIAVAKAQEKVNKIEDSLSSASKDMDAFSRMEKKVDEMLDLANAKAELNAKPADPAAELEAKYAVSAPSVDDELAKMKEELGL